MSSDGMQRGATLFSLMLAAAACGSPAAEVRARDGLGAQPGGSVAIDADRHVAFAADADNHAIQAIDLVSLAVTTTAVDGAPEQIVRLDRDRLAVTLRDTNRVAILVESQNGELEVEREVDVAVDPFGLARTPEGDLLVTSAFGRRLTLLDGRSLEPRFEVELAREPRGVAVTPKGDRAFVSHLVGDAVSIVELGGGDAPPQVHRVAAIGGAHRNRIDRAGGAGTLHPTSALAYAVAVSPSGARVFVPHAIEQNGASTTRSIPGAYGGVPVEEETSFASVAVIAASSSELVEGPGAPPVALDRTAFLAVDPLVGFAVAPSSSPARQARAVAAYGDVILVASQGTNEIVELDARALDPAMAELRHFPVGEGPKGVAVEASSHLAVAWSQIDHSFSVIALDSGAGERVVAADDPLDADVALGRRLFTTELDRRITRDGRACAGCHPEGRDDGVVWKLGAGPRQTPTLVGRVEHGPFGWLGKHARLEDNMRETIGRLGGTGLPEADLEKLAAFLRKGLVAPTRPEVRDPRVARGRELFASEKVGCASCHVLDNEASDRAVHDVASRAPGDTTAGFRTPPLLYVGDTAPYFHDGRYASLEALLRDDLDRMGQTTQLSNDDLGALAAYLRTL